MTKEQRIYYYYRTGVECLNRGRRADAALMVAGAVVVLVLLLPIGGAAGAWLSEAARWMLVIPIGAVFRGMLIGVAILAAVFAARTMLGVGTTDE